MKRLLWTFSLSTFLLSHNASWARIEIMISESQVIELPRSNTLTAPQPQQRQREDVRRAAPIQAAKPAFLRDEELLSIPTHFLPPELQKRQETIRQRVEAERRAPTPAPTKTVQKTKPPGPRRVKVMSATPSGRPSGRVVSVSIDETVWVPPTATGTATTDSVLQVHRRLPDVQILAAIDLQASEAVQKEINPGEVREIDELFARGQSKIKEAQVLMPAYHAYQKKDYATAVSLALHILNDPKQNEEQKQWARYLAAHSLIQAGYYASALPLLNNLVTSKWRRSAIGMAAIAIEKTRDDSAAYSILSKVSLTQIPDNYRSAFAFHLGRVLMQSGAGEAALAAFEKIDILSPRYPETQYYMGVIKTISLPSRINPEDWDRQGSAIFEIRRHFEAALVESTTREARDLRNLAHISMARLAYQSQNFHQSVYHYREVHTDSPFLRDALFEMAWSLYRIGEHNRSMGALHPLQTSALEGRDYAELWILRSLNYLKLCRFEEATKTAGSFEIQRDQVMGELAFARNLIQDKTFQRASDLERIQVASWIRSVLMNDPITQKDLTRESLLRQEQERLKNLQINLRVENPDVRELAYEILFNQLEERILSLGQALKPFLLSKISDALNGYHAQKDRLDYLKFEIYSQAARYPRATERLEAQKLLERGDFLPGLYLKGREVLWRFSGEYWHDEVMGYDYFLPSECF